MTVFTRTWDAAYEAVPADSDQISEGALRIRQTRVDVQERGVVDHSWAGDVEDGTHKKVTFTDPLAVKPTQELDNTYLYTKDVSATSELFFEDESGNEVQLTNGGETFDDALFPAGTKCLFYQAAAPAGGLWVIDDTITNYMLRVVDTATGTGGTSGGSDSPIQMTGAQVPQHTHVFTGNAVAAHTHNYRLNSTFNATQALSANYLGRRTSDSSSMGYPTFDTNNTVMISSGGGHTPSGTNAANGANATWDPKYADVIICTRQ